jgi:hypothetical protein
LENVLGAEVDRDILLALDFLIGATKNEFVLRGDINSKLVSIGDHIEDLHLEGLADQSNPRRPASEHKTVGLSVVRDFACVYGSSRQLVDHRQSKRLNFLRSLIDSTNQLFQTGGFGW